MRDPANDVPYLEDPVFPPQPLCGNDRIIVGFKGSGGKKKCQPSWGPKEKNMSPEVYKCAPLKRFPLEKSPKGNPPEKVTMLLKPLSPS